MRVRQQKEMELKYLFLPSLLYRQPPRDPDTPPETQTRARQTAKQRDLPLGLVFRSSEREKATTTSPYDHFRTDSRV